MGLKWALSNFVDKVTYYDCQLYSNQKAKKIVSVIVQSVVG